MRSRAANSPADLRSRSRKWLWMGSGVVLGFALATSLGLGPGAGARAVAASPAKASATERAAFDHAVDLVLRDFVEPVDRPRLLGRALRHMVAGLDAHSVYLDAATRERWQRQRSEGLTTGLSLRRAGDGSLEVAAVMPGSPAEAEGLSVGDRLRTIADRPDSEFTHPLLAEIALTSLDGRPVSAVVEAASTGAARSVDITVTRVDKVPVVHAHLVGAPEGAKAGAARKKIGAIAIHAFMPGVGDQVKRELAELRRAAGGRLDGLILDLRGNPGGEVNEAILVAELFVAEGVLVRTRGRNHEVLSEERAHAAGSDTELPLLILQDTHSASAAELLAAALRGHGRAQVMGRTSYGKGTVQRLFGLPDGAQLRLTVARYFGPDDRAIDGRGVSPDLPLAPGQMPTAISHAWAHLAGN